MGLFSDPKKKNIEKYRNKYISFENGDYTNDDYDSLLYDMQNDMFDNDYDKYYAARAFMMTIVSSKVVNEAFADGEMDNLCSFMRFKPLNDLHDFIVNAWTLQDATNPDDVFIAVIKNRSFIKQFGTWCCEANYFDKGIYHAYVWKFYDLESANDEESVIFNRFLYENDDDTVELIIKYDVMLKNEKPEYRKEILYYDEEFEYDGKKFTEIKVKPIEEIEKKMTDLGIGFNRSVKLKL